MHDSEPHSPQFEGKINAEIIADTTAFKLVESYPATIHNDAQASRQFFQRLAMYKEWSGERNILTSFYTDADNTLQLGIFVRPLSEQPYLHDPSRAYTTNRAGGRPPKDSETQDILPSPSSPNLYLVRDAPSRAASREETPDEPPSNRTRTLGHIAATDTTEPDNKL
jgi:hypothetical protein